MPWMLIAGQISFVLLVAGLMLRFMDTPMRSRWWWFLLPMVVTLNILTANWLRDLT